MRYRIYERKIVAGSFDIPFLKAALYRAVIRWLTAPAEFSSGTLRNRLKAVYHCSVGT